MIDRGPYFRVTRAFLSSDEWKALPRVGRIVYPAVAVHANANGRAFPSVDRIAYLSGVDIKTAREGLRAIFDGGLPGHRRVRTFTPRGKSSYTYFLPTPPRGSRGVIFLYKNTILTQSWQSIGTTAKDVYLALLTVCFFEFGEYDTAGNSEHRMYDDEFYPEREYDYAEPELEWICGQCGIKDIRTLRKALSELQKFWLVKVDVTPWRIYLPPFLNSFLRNGESCLAKGYANAIAIGDAKTPP